MVHEAITNGVPWFNPYWGPHYAMPQSNLMMPQARLLLLEELFMNEARQKKKTPKAHDVSQQEAQPHEGQYFNKPPRRIART